MEPEFELESKSIDAAALEEELARRVARRRAAGVYSHEVEAMLAERLPDEEDPRDLPPASALDYAATRALAGWEVTAAYPVETEKRLVRPLVLLAKRAARLWARIAVGPIQREQTAFNRHVAMALEALKREAVSERTEAIAAEADLESLAESMIGAGEARDMEAAVVESLAGAGSLVVLGPCPESLARALASRFGQLHRVSAGSAWDAATGTTTRAGPLAFLSQVPEGSLDALLVCELAFWLKPEALVGLARRAYLALAPAGRVAVGVHSFAARAPAPAWYSPGAVARALEMAGFDSVSVRSLPGGDAGDFQPGYVAAAGKR